MSTKSHEVIFGSQGRTTSWRSCNSRVLKATSPRKWSRPPSRGRQSLKNMAPNFFGYPVSHRRVGRRVAHHDALLELGSLWKGAGGSGEGRGIREADDTYSYLCRTKRPQHRRRRRSLTTPCWLPQPIERLARGGTPPVAWQVFLSALVGYIPTTMIGDRTEAAQASPTA